MPSARMTLNESLSVTLDGSGNGTVQMTPDGPHEHWYPTIVSVKASTAVSEATCKIYVGHKATDENFVDGTFSGSSGDSTDSISGYEIARTRNPAIFAVWAGGDAGARATLTINGTKDIR